MRVLTYWKNRLFIDWYRSMMDFNVATRVLWRLSSGSDGEKEALLYPNGTTAGNYGTVNIPSGSSNSTNTLGNQISNGIPPSQLELAKRCSWRRHDTIGFGECDGFRYA